MRKVIFCSPPLLIVEAHGTFGLPQLLAGFRYLNQLAGGLLDAVALPHSPSGEEEALTNDTNALTAGGLQSFQSEGQRPDLPQQGREVPRMFDQKPGGKGTAGGSLPKNGKNNTGPVDPRHSKGVLSRICGNTLPGKQANTPHTTMQPKTI